MSEKLINLGNFSKMEVDSNETARELATKKYLELAETAPFRDAKEPNIFVDGKGGKLTMNHFPSKFSITVGFYVGEGSDERGVPTTLWNGTYYVFSYK